MGKRDPRPVMVIDEGKCQLIGEAKSNEFDGVQEPLPDAMRLLLCLIDGAERRHRLVRKWQSQAAPRPSRRSGGWRHHGYSAGNELRRDLL